MRVLYRFLVQARRVQINHRHREFGHQCLGRRLHQHRYRRAVLQGVTDAFLGVRRVDRHITGAGLEDAQQPDDHFQAALNADRHPVIRAHTQA